MPIPTCHLARKEYIYTAGDGTHYRRKFEAALITAIGSNMGVPGAGTGNLARLPKNIKPRFIYIETTNGTDANGNPKKYRRKAPLNWAEANNPNGKSGFVINGFEGCNWITRGFVDEKYRAR